ncbi:extracellular catalytic domain type 1 short-chain-length polyhydroxyalkanoate depolymerase [Micromonospora zhanjiangensis]|uniref:PHB depolymerase family esterase n=1 Tax=Micromonospora zhanjiangensis TaxID=1522057 RepID=A0ABV8KTM9_9ACTN
MVGVTVTVPALTRPASAASLTEVTNFGSNPGNLRMHIYVPDSVKPSPGVVVAMHGCGGNGPGFYSGSEFASLANQYGFIVIYPSASNKKQNCFDNWSDASKRRNGGSDPVSIASMVSYTLQRYSADPRRVFVTGSSSGGMMTNAMAALYPDVFAAGAAFMGVPFACFPNEGDYQPTPGYSDCASGRIDKSPQQWGDLVRQAYPGYSGPYPRMQLWHGTNDNLVYYALLQEEVDQWTNVHGLSVNPTSTDTPQPSWTRRRFADSSGTVRVEAISVSGAGHQLPMSGMAAQAIAFFGLNSNQTPPPTTGGPTTPPPTTPPPTTPPPTTPPPGGGACRVSYVANTWNTGLTANITITNTGSAAVNGWSLAFTLAGGQTITSGWNATYSPSSGQVTARNVNYNGTIPPGGSTSIGYQANHTGNTAAPTSFSLNGQPCSVA